jgi:hypothetical protein
MMDWTIDLPDNLIKDAYWYQGEAAWKKGAAIEVLGILKRNKYVILGVDVWIPTADGPRIPSKFVCDWDVTANQAMRKGSQSADQFIEKFRWSDDDFDNQKYEPYFVITADKLDG